MEPEVLHESRGYAIFDCICGEKELGVQPGVHCQCGRCGRRYGCEPKIVLIYEPPGVANV